jgi:hypothetical protein
MAAQGGGLQRVARRRVRAALVLSGLRWRAGSSLAMFAVAVFATGAAAFGPIYLHSADQLVLDGKLAGPPGSTGLTLSPVPAGYALRSLRSLALGAPEPGGRARWWGPPILTERVGFQTVPTTRPPAGSIGSASVTAVLPYGRTHPFAGMLLARTGECAHLDLVAGTCPHGTGVVVSTRTAHLLGALVGRALAVRIDGARAPVQLDVVGVYRAPAAPSPYWWGADYFGYGSFAAGSSPLVDVDAVFATPAGERVAAPARSISTMVQVPYRRGSLTVDGAGTMRQDLAAYGARMLHHDGVRVTTGLWGLLAQAGSTEHTAATVVAVADLELVLLGVSVLYFVASRTATEREAEVRLAELRGFGAASTVSVALLEPVAVVAAAVPTGLVGAWAVADVTAPAIFGTGVGASVTALALAAALAAGLAGVAAAGLGARRSLSPTPGSDGEPASLGRSRRPVVADVAVVALAGAAFSELVVAGASGGRTSGSDPLAALAPALLAVALGVLAARLLPGLLRATHQRTAYSRRVPGALAARTVARRREHGAQIVLSALAVSLATFAVSGWVVSGRNRDLRVELALGAAKVLTVSVRPGTTFLHAVRASDPTGRYAMAVVVEHARDGTTLALDASRLARVASWPADLGLPAAVAARLLLSGHAAPPVRVSGTAVSVTVAAATDARPAPMLGVDVFDVDTQFASRVTLGPVGAGTHQYTGSLAGDCPGGCRLVGLSLTWAPATAAATTARPPTVTLDVVALRERARDGRWVALRSGVGDLRRWGRTSGGVRLSDSGGELEARCSLNDFGAPLTFGPADVPPALPVLVTPTSDSTASGDGGPLVVGLDGSTLAGRRVGEIPALPGVSGDAVLANLQTAERFLGGPFVTDTTEVWLAGTAPRGVVARLGTHGVRVSSTRTAPHAVGRLAHSGLTLAYLLYLVSAVGAGLLVVGATGFALASAARWRQGELAALRALGIGVRSLRRAVLVEQALVLGAGAVVGTLAGVGAAAVALRSVPELVVKAPGPPLELGLPAAALAVTVGAIVVALACTVAVGSAAVVRGATVDRLAGGQS